jgi:hypothetical protein
LHRLQGLALDDGAHAVLPLLLFDMAIDISEILPVGWKCSYKCYFGT